MKIYGKIEKEACWVGLKWLLEGFTCMVLLMTLWTLIFFCTGVRTALVESQTKGADLFVTGLFFIGFVGIGIAFLLAEEKRDKYIADEKEKRNKKAS